VYALAMGKVVLGGAEEESLKAFDISSSPVVNITPSAEDIISKIEHILKSKKELKALGKESRLFAEKLHSYESIAQQYIDQWSS
jgi:glycosyltransferase involved in cell wall biosynthesis